MIGVIHLPFVTMQYTKESSSEGETYGNGCMQTHTDMDACKHIRIWMHANKLVLNDDKTVFLLMGRKTALDKVNVDSIKVGNANITPSDHATNLGSVWDPQLSMDKHVSKVHSSTFYHFRNIASIRKYLIKSQRETVVHAFITSKLDYCNSLLKGIPDYQIQRLQHVQNAAARIICDLQKYDHITSSLHDLHWLPVKHRIDFKILLLTYKCIHSDGPEYLSELVVPYVTCYDLRSKDKNTMAVPKTNLVSCGDRAFSKVAPALWNNLPMEIKCASDVDVFKKLLKTHLFKLAYDIV